MIDIPRTIALMEECGMTVRILGETSGPFRDYCFEDERYMLEMARIPGAYQMIDGTTNDWWSLKHGCRIPLRSELEVQRSIWPLTPAGLNSVRPAGVLIPFRPKGKKPCSIRHDLGQ